MPKIKKNPFIDKCKKIHNKCLYNNKIHVAKYFCHLYTYIIPLNISLLNNDNKSYSLKHHILKQKVFKI